MNFSKISGLNFGYTGKPGETGVLFIHGVGMNATNWRLQLDYLHEYVRCYCLDLPGHGNSHPFALKGQVTVDSYVEPIVEFMQNVEISNWVVVGHSLGALIALQLTQSAAADTLRGIVAISTVFQRTAAAQKRVQKRADDLSIASSESEPSTTLERWFGALDTTPYTQQYQQCKRNLSEVNRSDYATAYRAFAASAGIAASVVSNISCPVLYLTGQDDLNSTAQMSKNYLS